MPRMTREDEIKGYHRGYARWLLMFIIAALITVLILRAVLFPGTQWFSVFMNSIKIPTPVGQ
jgi:hypothetical protein